MDQIALLTKFRDKLSTYSEFSEINYETTFVSLFESVFGENNRFTDKAKQIASGWGAKGAVDAMYGKISEEQFNRNKQNVVFEAGLFLGLLGSEKVIMLCEKDLERPGDLDGCIYIEADEYGGWKEKIRAEFNAIGVEYRH